MGNAAADAVIAHNRKAVPSAQPPNVLSVFLSAECCSMFGSYSDVYLVVNLLLGKISGSHSGEYKDDSLLGNCIM
jgi:hypothetical protein